MGSRFVQPDTVRLNLSEGDWILVKKRLTAGEQRASYARMYTALDGVRHFDPQQSGIAFVLAYLLDWSLTDAEGKPVVIRDQPLEAVEATVNALDYDSFVEIKEAIEKHENTVNVEREAKKKTLSGEPKSTPISPSPVAVGGDTSGSPSSIPTSTRSSSIN